jgi:hypothetical protein
MDGFTLNSMHMEAMRHWRAGRWEEAKAWFVRAADHAKGMIEEYDRLSSLYVDRERFYRALPGVLDLSRKAGAGGLPAKRALLDGLQKVLLIDADDTLGSLDEGFLWVDENPDCTLNALKQELAGGQDANEFNDGFGIFSTRAYPRALHRANLAPRGLDRDIYSIHLPSPRGSPALLPLPAPVKLRLAFDRPDTARMDLKVTVLDPERKSLVSGEIRGQGHLDVTATVHGIYHVRVEPLDPDADWPEATRYTFRWYLAN